MGNNLLFNFFFLFQINSLRRRKSVNISVTIWIQHLLISLATNDGIYYFFLFNNIMLFFLHYINLFNRLY